MRHLITKLLQFSRYKLLLSFFTLFEPLTISLVIRLRTKPGPLRVQEVSGINYSRKTVLNAAVVNKSGHAVTWQSWVTGAKPRGWWSKVVSTPASPLHCFPRDASLYWWILYPETSGSSFNVTVLYILLSLLRLNGQGWIFKIYVINFLLTFADAVHELRSTGASLGTEKSQFSREFSSTNNHQCLLRAHMTLGKIPQGKYFPIWDIGAEMVVSCALPGILPALILVFTEGCGLSWHHKGMQLGGYEEDSL